MTNVRFLRTLRTAAPLALALCLVAPMPAAAQSRNAEAAASYKRGFSAYERGDYRAARIELLKSIKADPNDALSRLLQARVMLQLGNGVAAQTEVERALQAGAPRDKTRHLMAEALVLQRQFDRALTEADARTVPPQFASSAARIRGRALIGLQQVDKAGVEFQRSVELAPNSSEAAIDLARFQVVRGDRAAATASADRALALAPRDVRALLLKGDIVRGSVGLQQAMPYFDKAVSIDPNNVEALLERAATLGDLRREREARADLKRVQGFIPDHPLALYLEAVLAARAGQYQQANALMTRTKGLLNQYPPALLLQGMLAYQLGNLSAANDTLGKVVAQAPNSILARKLYGATQLRRNDNDGAIDTLRPLVAEGQKPDARTLALIGSAFARKGDFATAQQYLEKASRAAPGEEAVRTQLAMTRVAQGDDAGATADLSKVLAEDKNSLQAMMMLSLIDLRKGQYKTALGNADRIVRAYPELPMGYNMRGAAQLGLNNIKGAETDFRNALAKKPDFNEARRNLAQLLVATNRAPEARRELLKVLETSEDDTRAMISLADIAARSGNQPERIDWLRRATAANPRTPAPRAALVQAYMQTRQPNRAITEATALERAFPTNPGAVQLAGMTRLATNRAGEAESSFNRLVQLQPDAVAPRIMLARAQIAQKKYDDARGTLNQALTLPRTNNLVPVYADLVALEASQKRMPQAIAAAQRLRAAYPKLNAADIIIGDIHIASRNPTAAIKSYEAARAVRFDRLAATKLASAYAGTGQRDRAISTLQAYRKAQPNDPVAVAALADVYVTAKQYRAAVPLYEQLVRGAGARDAAVLNNLAWSYHQLRDKRAAGMAERALKLAPRAPAILDTAGWILVDGRTNPKRGLALLQQAVKASPRDADMRYHLAVAYRANGRSTDAVRELRTALQNRQFENAAPARTLLAQLQRG